MIKYKVINVIDCDDWDNLVQNTYGKPYILQQQNGCMERQRIKIIVPPERVEDFPNDTLEDSISENGLGVSFKAWLEKDPNEISSRAEKNIFWGREFYPSLSTVINDLYKKRLLDAGEYEIDIDW